MHRPHISVIIPIYNTGDLLNRTLESVTRQTLSDIEIICVDDCSTDDSLAILRAWEQKDPRVRVISFEQNQGVSAARNAGIDNSWGGHIYFLDSDDWIDPDYLEAMYSKALETGQDVVLNVNYLKEYEEPGYPAERESWGLTEPGYYPTAIVQSHMLCVIWTRLYNRDFLVRNNIRFPIIGGGAEDIYFTALAEVLQPRSYVFFGPRHHYWQRAGSLFHQKSNGFYYVQSYKLLYDELLKRGVALDGLKLFHCGTLEVDTEEKFNFIRAYAQKIDPLVKQHPEYYTGHDLLLLDAVLSSPDYSSFLSAHHPNLAIEYLRKHLKNQQNHA